MYYYIDTDGVVRLLDGDKIASLSAMFIMDLVKAAGIELKVGVVQTAYANGNSTSYLSKVLVSPPPHTIPAPKERVLMFGTENSRVMYTDGGETSPP
jgi:hypothetical protein